MRTFTLPVMSVAVALLMGACSGGGSAAAMPDIVGERLDLAYSDLAAAGVQESDVEVVGGGTFGVLNESNWTVCEQRPAPGAAPEAVRVVVDRSCDVTDATAETDAETSASGDEADNSAGAGDSGSARFKMPDVRGMVLQDAQDLLQSKGSYLMDQVDATGMDRFQVLDSNWKVCSQKPKPGTKVTDETLITLAAVKLDEDCP